MNVMRNCTLIEVRRIVRRVVTCAERNTEMKTTPEKNPLSTDISVSQSKF
jgi:hypothetical protein